MNTLSNEFVLIIGLALGFIIGTVIKYGGININSGNKEDWGSDKSSIDEGDEWKNK